jgi:hypothetical protein
MCGGSIPSRTITDAAVAVAPSNYALERPVKGLAVGAEGAWNNCAPAAHGPRFARAAQRGR